MKRFFWLLFISGVVILSIAFVQEKQRLIIVAFGDSTTAPRRKVDSVYAVRVHYILDRNGIDNEVINSGIPGSTTGSIKDNSLFKIPHGMDRFDTAVLRYHPDWVIIDFGINDSWQDVGKKGTSRIPLIEYEHNIVYFINQIHKIGGEVILLTPNPLGRKYRGFHTRRLEKYKQAVLRIGKENNVQLIDTWKLFKEYAHKRNENIDALLLDGEHPNDIGHKIIADAITAIILKNTSAGGKQKGT